MRLELRYSAGYSDHLVAPPPQPQSHPLQPLLRSLSMLTKEAPFFYFSALEHILLAAHRRINPSALRNPSSLLPIRRLPPSALYLARELSLRFGVDLIVLTLLHAALMVDYFSVSQAALDTLSDLFAAINARFENPRSPLSKFEFEAARKLKALMRLKIASVISRFATLFPQELREACALYALCCDDTPAVARDIAAALREATAVELSVIFDQKLHRFHTATFENLLAYVQYVEEDYDARVRPFERHFPPQVDMHAQRAALFARVLAQEASAFALGARATCAQVTALVGHLRRLDPTLCLFSPFASLRPLVLGALFDSFADLRRHVAQLVLEDLWDDAVYAAEVQPSSLAEVASEIARRERFLALAGGRDCGLTLLFFELVSQALTSFVGLYCARFENEVYDAEARESDVARLKGGMAMLLNLIDRSAEMELALAERLRASLANAA
jgi:hypothetical protein